MINQPILIMKSFALEPYLSLIEKYKVRDLQTVPPVLVMLHKRPEVAKYDLSSVRSIMCGAAPVSKDVEVAVATKHGWRFLGGFGMTELYCMGFANSLEQKYHVASIGTLLPNMEMKILDNDGKEVDGYGPNAAGELYLRGPQVAAGYWENKEATEETFGGGWLKTGDVGYVKEDGFVWLVDRKKVRIQISQNHYNAHLLTSRDLQ